jgi:DNA polymerase-4
MAIDQKKYIAHLDLDCFFVSVERIGNPGLLGKPVVVGGDPSGRGVVASASYEARKFGIHSAMPTARALRLCPDLIVIHGRHGEYAETSRRLYDYLLSIAPVVERASIDEMNIDFTGCESLYHENLSVYIKELQQNIREKFQLPCTIALASNKLIAKIAANRVKPNGVITISHGTESQFLAPLPIDCIPGVGEKTAVKLHAKGIRTISQCQILPEAELVHLLGSFGVYLYRAVRGDGSTRISMTRVRKSVSKEETFSTDIKELHRLESTLFSMVEDICSQCRKNGWKAGTVTVKFRYADFTTFTRQQSCRPTDFDPEIFAITKQLFHTHYDRNRPLRLIGVGLSNFLDNTDREPSLFEDSNEKSDILKAVDSLRKKFGSDVIRFGNTSI